MTQIFHDSLFADVKTDTIPLEVSSSSLPPLPPRSPPPTTQYQKSSPFISVIPPMTTANAAFSTNHTSSHLPAVTLMLWMVVTICV